MPLNAKDNAKDFKPLEAGTHVARINSIIHIGTIADNIKGEEVIRNRVFISFEIPEALKEDGTPFTVGQEFTMSMNKRGNLLPFLESMLGKKLTGEEAKEFDLYKLIGQEAMINVIHSAPNSEGMVYANIKSVSPLPKNVTCPPAINKPVLFDYDENFDAEFVFKLNEKSQLYKKITRSEEWLSKGVRKPDGPYGAFGEDETKK